MYVDFIEPCFGIGHNLSLICQMTSEDIKHQLIIIILASLGVSLHLLAVLHKTHSEEEVCFKLRFNR